MPQISIRPGDSLAVAEDITIQFDKFDFINGCSRLDIYDAYHELSVVRGPEPNPTEGEIQDRLQRLARDIASGLSALAPVQSKAILNSFVSELFMSVAKQELRETRHQRQAEGIAAAKARGVQLGRSPNPLPENFEECYEKWRDGEISMSKAAAACGMSKTWFRGAVTRKEQAAECAV